MLQYSAKKKATKAFEGELVFIKHRKVKWPYQPGRTEIHLSQRMKDSPPVTHQL